MMIQEVEDQAIQPLVPHVAARANRQMICRRPLVKKTIPN